MKKSSRKRRARSPVSRPVNIVICGVGGQGIILASNILCHAAFLEGNDVKKSEVHGMAQRGGSVITHVRFGVKVHSPLIEEGSADYLLAFEKLEALRYLHFLRLKGIAIVNEREIAPMSVLIGTAPYPANIGRLLGKRSKPHYVRAEDIAGALGNTKVVNVVLLGVLSRFLTIGRKSWGAAIRHQVKARFVDLNMTAFNKGRAIREAK